MAKFEYQDFPPQFAPKKSKPGRKKSALRVAIDGLEEGIWLPTKVRPTSAKNREVHRRRIASMVQLTRKSKPGSRYTLRFGADGQFYVGRLADKVETDETVMESVSAYSMDALPE